VFDGSIESAGVILAIGLDLKKDVDFVLPGYFCEAPSNN
jgi:hypothetical protein